MLIKNSSTSPDGLADGFHNRLRVWRHVEAAVLETRESSAHISWQRPFIKAFQSTLMKLQVFVFY